MDVTELVSSDQISSFSIETCKASAPWCNLFFYVSNKLLNEHTSSTDDSLTEASNLKKGEILGCENSLMFRNVHTLKVLY
jgi:hypothetical protein